MSEILVGTAWWNAVLRYEQFTQGVSAVEQQIARLRQLTSKPLQLTVGAASSGAAGSGGASSPDAQAAAYTRLQRAQAALEANQAKLARAQGDTARAAQLEAQAEERLTSELNALNGVTTQSIALERQLTQLQLQRARVKPPPPPVVPQDVSLAKQFGDSFKSGLINIVGPAALATAAIVGLRSAISGGIEAGREALALREQKNALQAVSGSAGVYAEALATARRQQLLFGGSIQENIEGLQGLVITSRDTGANLAALVDLSQRLSIKSPEQGAGGSRLALAEAFSEGNITSLSRRFEIPKAKIEALRDASIPAAEKIKVLSDYLDTIGISSAAVAGKIDQDALAFRQLGQEVGDARLKAGDGLATAFAGTALGLSRLIGVYNSNPEAIAQILALRALGGSGTVGPADVERQARNLRGADVIDAQSRAGAPAFARDKLQGTNINTLALDASRGKLLLLGASSDDARNKVIALYDAFGHTGNVQAFIEGQRQLEGATRLGSKAIDESKAAIGAELAEKIKSQIETGQLAAQQAQLDIDSQRAAQGMLGAGNQALLLAEKYGIAVGQAQFLIREQQKIGIAAGLADHRLGERDLNTNLDAATAAKFGKIARQGEIERQNDAKKAADKAASEAQQLQAARDNLALSRATTSAQKIAIYQQQLARTTDQVERLRIQAQIEGERRGGAGRVSAAQSTALQLNQVEQNSGLQLLKTQRENLERLRDQQLDYDIKRKRGAEDFQEDYQRLLNRGQRVQAQALKAEFEKDRRREAEDRAIQLRRTLRNNAEGVGDIGARADLRQSQIGDRAALRGVRAAGGVDLGVAPPTLAGAAPAAGQARQQQVAQLTIQGVVTLDGKAVGTGVWPTIEVLVDEELAVSLALAGVPGSGQSAVGGPG